MIVKILKSKIQSIKTENLIVLFCEITTTKHHIQLTHLLIILLTPAQQQSLQIQGFIDYPDNMVKRLREEFGYVKSSGYVNNDIHNQDR